MPEPIIFSPEHVDKNLDLLYPVFRRLVEAAISDAYVKEGLRCAVFEAWRSPNRQAWLYDQGRGRPGKIVTGAKAWESWHQFSLAVDIVYLDLKKQVTWEGDFDKLAPYFLKFGLERPLPKTDAGHYQLTGGLALPIAKGLYASAGLQRVWLEASGKVPASPTTPDKPKIVA